MQPTLHRTVSMQREEKQQGGEELSWTCDTSKVEELNSLFTYKSSENILCQSQYNIFGYNQENPQLKNISLFQNHGNQQPHNSIDMSSSSSFLDSYNQSQPAFLPPKASISSPFNASHMHPFDSTTCFDFVCDPEPLQDMQNPKHASRVLNNPFSPSDLQGFEFVNRDSQFVNVLKPLDECQSQVDKDATIFQRRMAHIQNSGGGSIIGNKGKMPMEGIQQSSMKSTTDDESCMNSIDGSGILVHSLIEQSRDDNLEGNSEYAGDRLKNMGIVIGDNHKGKRKGPPAKNLMAERRRRKKLNDRLYTLRSIVPNISKMDRASILSDAIGYVKMLLQRIDDLRKELEATPIGHSPQPSASLEHLIKIPSIREEHCLSKLPRPVNKHIEVEVRAKEGRSVNIHMCSPSRPGLLLYTMRALENIGLDVQQAVVSCLNGFALDIFHAEQSEEGPDVLPEQIRAILLDAVATHDLMPFNQL